MVFIHGGGNTQGSAGERSNGVALYDGQALVEQQRVVLVTIQYRIVVAGSSPTRGSRARSSPE